MTHCGEKDAQDPEEYSITAGDVSLHHLGTDGSLSLVVYYLFGMCPRVLISGVLCLQHKEICLEE